MKLGDGLLVIASAEHREAFATQLRSLGIDAQATVEEGWLVWLDAEETLARFMVDGQPNWARFERTIQCVIGKLRRRADHTGTRVYGEMVGVLWKSGQFAAAIRLEKFWNKLLKSIPCKLYCGYPIDVFSEEFQTAGVEALLCAHTHLVPAGENGDLQWAIHLAMDEILGPKVDGLKALVRSKYRYSGAKISNTEAMILSLREKIPAAAEEILARAREHYQSEKRFLRRQNR